jgi:CAAX protease family protein
VRAFAWFIAMFVIGFAAIAALSYPAWLLLHPYFSFPFHRVGERIGMIALLAAFLVLAPRLKVRDRASLGYGASLPTLLREIGLGALIGVVTMTVVVGLMTALGLLDWAAAASFDAPAVVRLFAARLLSALAVALIEETFLRGAMLTAIRRESGSTVAVALTALVYALSHFFASFHIPPEQVTASSGLDLLGGTLHLLAQPLGIADAFLCLFAVGVVLGAVRVATGNIAACIGLHAGWVWVMLVAHEMSHPVRSATLSFLLSRFDGFVGWLVLAWTVLLGLGLRRFYAGRTLAST